MRSTDLVSDMLSLTFDFFFFLLVAKVLQTSYITINKYALL